MATSASQGYDPKTPFSRKEATEGFTLKRKDLNVIKNIK